MSKINPDAPAMPTANSDRGIETGLTIRQQLAAMAMQGLCANSVPGNHHQFENLAKEAVMYADALINELNK